MRQLEGDLDNPDSLVFEAIDLYLMDIGTHGSTAFSYGPELVNAYDENESLMDEGVRTALIHSHHNMPTFFSGTDKEELEDNTPEDVDMYLSLVVNNKMSWDCKISMFGTRNVKTEGWFKKLGAQKANHRITRDVTERVLYIIDVDVTLDNLGALAQRANEVSAKKAALAAIAAQEAAKLTNNQYKGNGWNNQNYAKQLGIGDDVRTNISKATDMEEIPEELPKLLMLSEHYMGDFEMALNFVEEKFSSPTHLAQYMANFRKQFIPLLEQLKKVALDGKEDEPAWMYEMSCELLDEILAWKGSKVPIFRAITDELEQIVDGMFTPDDESEDFAKIKNDILNEPLQDTYSE